MYSTCPEYLPRKRARSEDFLTKEGMDSLLKMQYLSRHSESNLMHIDREKTFEQQLILDTTAELLTKVVTALNDYSESGVPDDVAGGYNLFTDDDILQDEIGCGKMRNRSNTLGSVPQAQRPRSRSEFTGMRSLSIADKKWAEKEAAAADYAKPEMNDKEPKTNNGVTIAIDYFNENAGEGERPRNESVLQKLNIFKRRNTFHQDLTSPKEAIIAKEHSQSPLAKIKDKFLSNTPVIERRISDIFTEPIKRHPNLDEIRRSSGFSTPSTTDKSENVLENTTIADLIRAIESAHTKDHGIDVNELSISRRNSTNASLRSSMRDYSLPQTPNLLSVSRRQSTNPSQRSSIRDQPLLLSPKLLGVGLNASARRSSLHPNHIYLRQQSAPTNPNSMQSPANQAMMAVDESNTQSNSNLHPSFNGSRRFSAFPGNPQRFPEYLRSRYDQSTPTYVRRRSMLPTSPLATFSVQSQPPPQPKILVRRKAKRKGSKDAGDKKNIRDLV